ncbi:MAG: hypothetical protein ACR2PU_00100, partial [Gammaproteobacteria bacterium]
MASVDKDVDVNKVILNEEQFDSSSNKNQIPDAGDQSSNFPKEELFKQNIQMGEAGQSIQDEGLQQAEPHGNEKLNSSSKSSSVVNESQNDSTQPTLAETSLGSSTASTSPSSKSNNGSNASNETNSVLFSESQNTQQDSSLSDTHASQSAGLNISENSNNQDYSNSPSQGSSENSQIDSDASTPILNVENAAGDEDSAISLDVSAALTDTDGSESLIIEIKDIPEGATLSDGANIFSATASSTSVDISEWNYDNLTITPVSNSDTDFNLKVSATSIEQSNNNTATTEATLTVSVTAVNDAPDGISLDGNTISENIDGAVVGTVTTSDVDSGDTHIYSVSDDRFEVVNDGSGNMQLKVKDGQSFNYEKDSSVEVTVTSTDASGMSTSEAFAINIT